MRTETVTCDRCKRDATMVNPWPYRKDGQKLTVHGLSISAGGLNTDLCGPCTVAMLEWIKLGETS
jgi:hypothetical protein